MRLRIGVVLAQFDVSYEAWRDAALQADQMGVDMITVVDHFFSMSDDGGCLESMSLLAAAAEITEQAELGHTVVGNSYRNPNLLANMARTIDLVSGGRFVLGIGSGGTLKRDYDEYGYEFGTAGSRLKDLATNLPVIRHRLDTLIPPPARPIPIMVGGAGERVTMRIAAEHADIWHSFTGPQQLPHKLSVLATHCRDLGRDVGEIEVASNVLGPGGEFDPSELVSAGATLLFTAAPFSRGAYDLSGLRELLQWRDDQARAANTAPGSDDDLPA